MQQYQIATRLTVCVQINDPIRETKLELSKAEERALAATTLSAFPIQLHEVRRTVKAILDLFGRNNIFSEYTVHDFSHVEAMLADLEWIIPNETKLIMTPADWLLITLSIYFHDLGLVVTEDEFKNRNLTAFEEFCQNVLFAKNDGQDYKIKIESLGEEQSQRFFYQEFVRFNHAKRVRAWIKGEPAAELGYARVQHEELNRLLAPIDSDFRHDLAVVCESHNLDDLDDLTKYVPLKPYGPNPGEIANLLYAAVVLRATDLLQITKHRAPSVMFRMINPTDPISQIEWTKQNAVKAVMAKPAVDKAGNVSSSLQSDTVSFYAKYDNENGFFGLTSYLAYAEKQLSYCYDCAQKAKSRTLNKLDFPWRGIDDSHVEAVGFIPNPFEFQIDQTKILDLLTGHTLYNDSSVAIREIVQNSIDAVRLQNKIAGTESVTSGKIKITWKSDDLTLTILDNGTGMTQDIIVRHLLNVGSSRYQDPQFKERYPEFSPISRFGIGVLSTFMVADNVQIITFHEDEEMGRQVSLRSVHGKYLIRLLDKKTSDEAKEIGPHGTKITLKMRVSSKRVNVLQTLEQWIMFPRCNITAFIDDEPPKTIGYISPKVALETFLAENQLGFKKELVEVQEKRIGGTTLAFAMLYNRHYRDRGFLQFSESMQQRTVSTPPMGVCIEGIRVEFSVPGFQSRAGLLSIVNCDGSDAPKTNVARSALESEADRANLHSVVLDAYLQQVQDEITRLQNNEGFSLSYAVEQFPFIAGPLYTNSRNTQNYTEAFKNFPMFMVEDENGRRAASTAELRELGGFWTVESTSMTSLIQLLKDTPSKVTCKQVAEFSHFKGAPLPPGTLVTNSYLSTMPQALMDGEFEICELRASTGDRRIDSKWLPAKIDDPKWINSLDVESNAGKTMQDQMKSYRRFRDERGRRYNTNLGFQIPVSSFPTVGLDNFFGIVALGVPRFVPDTEIAKYFINLDCKSKPENTLQFLLFMEALAPCFQFARTGRSYQKSEIEYSLRETTARFETLTDIDVIGFLDAVSKTEDRLAVFNPWSWDRDETVEMDEFEF